MENVLTDSSAVAVDSTALVQDSVAEVQMPTPEQLGISIVSGSMDANGVMSPLSVTVGDTFEFPVTVSWSVNGSALLVVPTNSATAKGLEQIGVSQESSRAVKDGKEVASITFKHKIVAQDTGDLNIPVMKFEIPTPMGTPLTLRSESVPVRVEAPVSVVPGIVGAVVALCVIVAGLFRAKRRSAARAELVAKAAAHEQLREKMMVLKQRIFTADSRGWLLDLENVCKEYAAEKFHLDAPMVNLEELHKMGDLDGWDALLETFAQARYGGGNRGGFENKETWKAAMKLMGVEED